MNNILNSAMLMVSLVAAGVVSAVLIFGAVAAMVRISERWLEK